MPHVGRKWERFSETTSHVVEAAREFQQGRHVWVGYERGIQQPRCRECGWEKEEHLRKDALYEREKGKCLQAHDILPKNIYSFKVAHLPNDRSWDHLWAAPEIPIVVC